MTSTLAHISEKPWGSYSQSDYDISQWHRACLIHNHTGTPTSKSECKVPVKTPDGTLSRSGVHAAAAALAGARGGVHASAEQMASAKTALRGLYSQLSETAPDSLSHVGVKGMHWGVRKDVQRLRDAGTKSRSMGLVKPGGRQARKVAKADKKFEKNPSNLKTYIGLHNKAAELTNRNDVDRINNKPEYKNKDFTNDSPLRRKYYKEHEAAYIANAEKAAAEFGTNASGTRKLSIKETSDGDWEIHVVDVQHASTPDAFDLLDSSTIQVFYDSMGHITRIEPPNSMQQSDLTVDEFLEHIGVKGMRWGVRRSEGGSGGKKSSSAVPAHEDFARATSLHTHAKSHGTKALSNKEMQDVITRMNLEQQYSKLTVGESGGSKAVKVGRDFGKGVLKNVGQQVASEILKGHAMAFVVKKGITAKK